MGAVQDAIELVSVEDELEAVYRREGDRLWRSLFAFSGDRDVASDAVAEAFAQALRRGAALRDPARWIWRAAFRIAGGELKRRRRSRSGAAIDEAGEEADVGAFVDLVRAFQRLSPSQRASVLLFHYAGYPVREVAAILGSTPAAVRVHLSTGRRRLRALLEVDDG
jgi:RNA polymerase sigma-70 factor, ECF subfamily